MYKVYGDYRSGNCYKIKLAMSLLGIDYQWVPVDILKGETQTPEFLAKNPNGKIPVLELEDGSCLWESNAILNFLADGSALLPSEPRLRTQVLQWQFFEQYSHEPYVAVARFIKLYLGLPEARRAVDDGWLWPVERRLMADAGHIRQRMAEDIEAGRRQLGAFACFGEDELAALGWSREQILAHATAAFAVVKAERKALTRRAA